MITKAGKAYGKWGSKENRNYSNNEKVAGDKDKKGLGNWTLTYYIEKQKKAANNLPDIFVQKYRGTSTTKRKGLKVDKSLLRATGIYQAVEIQGHQRDEVTRYRDSYV